MDSVSMDTVLSLLFRHFMTVASGTLIATGYVPGTITKEQIIGAGMGAGAIALSWWNKRGYHLLMDKVHEIKGDKPNVVTAPK